MGNLNSKPVFVPPDNLVMAPDDMSYADLYKETETNPIVVSVCLSPLCQISRELNSELPQIAANFPTVKFFKINTEKNHEIPLKVGAQTFPHITILVKKDDGDAGEYGHIIGYNRAELEKALTTLTKPPEPKNSNK